MANDARDGEGSWRAMGPREQGLTSTTLLALSDARRQGCLSIMFVWGARTFFASYAPMPRFWTVRTGQAYET